MKYPVVLKEGQLSPGQMLNGKILTWSQFCEVSPFSKLKTCSNPSSQKKLILPKLIPDLEKAESSASSAYGHFVQNPAILRTFYVKNPAFLTEDGGRRVEEGKLRIDQCKLRLDNGKLRIKKSEMRLAGCELRIYKQDLRNLPCYT